MPNKTRSKFHKTSFSLLRADYLRAQAKIDKYFAGNKSAYMRHLILRDLESTEDLAPPLPENEVELRAKLGDALKHLDALNQKLRNLEQRKHKDRDTGSSASN